MTRKEISRALRNPKSFDSLVASGVAESDHLEFKKALNRNPPKWATELRADCAGLASTGEGFLVIGVEETSDGTNRALAAVGVPDPADVSKSIEDQLGHSLSPPISRREVWPILAADGTCKALVVRVRGTPGLPIEVTDKSDPPRFVVREAGKKAWLNSEEARLRRRAQDRRILQVWLAVLSALVVLAVAVVAWLQTTVVQLREMAAPPTLILKTHQLQRVPEGIAVTLQFQRSKNAALGTVQFVATVADSDATILDFWPAGSSAFESGPDSEKISEDGKQARLLYSLIGGGGFPAVRLVLSDEASVVVSSNYLKTPIVVQVDAP